MTGSIWNRRWLGRAGSGILLGLASVSSALAQEATPSTPPTTQAAPADATAALNTGGAITADAQAVLDRMRATFNATRKYAVTARITRDEVLPFGYKLQNTESARMWVDGSNKLRMEVSGDVKNRTYVYDGAELTTYVPDLNVYAKTAAPATLGELVLALLDLGIEMPLIDLLYQGNAGNLTEDVRVGLVVGDSEVEGTPTDHLAFRQPLVDWQLWVEKGPRALPRKLVITTRYEVGDPQYQAVLNWDLKGQAPANAFSFVPPSGARQVQSVTRLVASGEAK